MEASINHITRENPKVNPLHVMKSFVAAVAALVISLTLPQDAVAAEIDELRAAVVALQKRLDQLEARTQGAETVNASQKEQIAAVRGNVGDWVGNFTWKGDLRVRNETLDQQYAPERNRYRIRARAGFMAKVNDTVRSEFVLATTEGNDPRASNQSFTGENSRKPVELELAYAEWAPNAAWKLSAGKMRYPLIRPGQSGFVDADINPEGLAATWTKGDFFAGALYNLLEERSTASESALVGGQLAWRPKLGTGKLALGTSYMSFSGVQGRNPFYNNSANGNTTTSVVADCRGATPCLVNDYDLIELFADWSQPVAGRPLSLYVDYVRNASAVNDQDTAYSTGVTYGRASAPRSWEVGFAYQRLEKDALFAQFIESDFAGGVTDSGGSVFKLAYAPARNWVINGTYFINDTNIDVPVTVPGVGVVQGRDIRRLQLDLNYKY